ncbi:MAG: cadherin-like domain-containing protein, partial [Sulfurospirillum cavolei]|nr:cadherin-like domain-containing protein [Sulfurospirillum cavolei]
GSYTFIPAANYNGSVPTISYTTTDGTSSDTSSLNISVTAVTDGFSDADETVSTTEDTTLSGSVLSGTTSVDGSVSVSGFSVNGTSYAAGTTATITGVGTISIASDGSYTFIPAANYNGSVPTISYTTTDGTSSDTSSLNISVTAVTDAPTVSITATGITSETISLSNVTATGNGYTVKAYNADGTAGTISTHTSSPAGFGVSGTASGDSTELDYVSGTGSETIEVAFDNDVTSISVSFAWLASSETAVVYFYLDGTLVGTSTIAGGSDSVDAAVTLSPSSGSSFDTVVFAASGANSDYLINSITFDNEVTSSSSVTTDETTRSVELNIASSLTDTDGSETLSTTISGLPTGFVLTDGTNTVVATSSTEVIDITGWDISSLTLIAADNVVGTITLTVTGTSTESSTSLSASTTATIDVIVSAEDAISVTDDTVITNGTSVTIPEWALLYNDTSADSLSVSSTSGVTTSTSSGSITVSSVSNNDSLTYKASDTVTNLDDNTTTTTTDTGTVTFSRVSSSSSLNGKTSDDILIDTRSSNQSTTLNGNDGDDILIGGVGADKLYGGIGDDVLVYDSADTVANGGDGTDTLLFASDATVNLSNVATIASNIEVLDLTHATVTITNLNASDIITMTDSDNIIKITGDSSDTVTSSSSSTWTASTDQSSVDVGYTRYESTTSSGTTAYVDIQDTVKTDF